MFPIKSCGSTWFETSFNYKLSGNQYVSREATHIITEKFVVQFSLQRRRYWYLTWYLDSPWQYGYTRIWLLLKSWNNKILGVENREVRNKEIFYLTAFNKCEIPFCNLYDYVYLAPSLPKPCSKNWSFSRYFLKLVERSLLNLLLMQRKMYFNKVARIHMCFRHNWLRIPELPLFLLIHGLLNLCHMWRWVTYTPNLYHFCEILSGSIYLFVGRIVLKTLNL